MSGPNLFHKWEFQPAACACCTIDFTNADPEWRSLHIDQDLLSEPDAVALYEDTDFEDYEWGDQLEVTGSFPPGSGFEITPTVLAAVSAKRFDEIGGTGRTKTEYRWHVQPRDGQEWREMDGPGITVKWSEQTEHFTYNVGTHEYEPADTTFSEKSEEILFSEGDIEGWTAPVLMETEEAESASLAGPALPVRFIVNVDGPVNSWEPPAQSFEGPRTIPQTQLAMYYSERTPDGSNDLVLTFEHLSVRDEVTITWSQRTVDRDGVQIGALEDGTVTLTTGDPTDVTVDAPDDVGRIYCFGFAATETDPDRLPTLVPLQESPDLAT